MATKWRSFWSGVGGGCAFVTVTLLARVLFSIRTLPELVQDRLVLLLPGPVFSFVLDHLLYLGKPLLFAALLALLIVLGGFGGMLMLRVRRPVSLPLLAWIGIGLVVLPLVGQGVFAKSIGVAATTLLSCAAYAVAFWLFLGYPRAILGRSLLSNKVSADDPAPEPLHPRRRLLAGGVLAVVTAGLAWRVLGRLPAPAAGAATPAFGGTAVAQPTSPLDPDPASAVGLPPAVTPTDRFYVVSKNLFDPEVKGAGWTLRIAGLVDNPLTLRYADLTGMPSLRVTRTLECISNEVGGDLISNGAWTGVRLADLLDRAGVKSEAGVIAFSSADGYTADLSLDQARDPLTILAYQLDGVPLAVKHGYPARLLATGIYGMKNPKWITQIDAVNGIRPGFWQQQGWDERGIIQTMAVVTTPQNGASVPVTARSLIIGGVAFAGSRGITQVEVSVDGAATWSPAQLLPSLGPSTWTLWQYQWQPPQSGTYTVLARATDGTGTVQPGRRTAPFPVGATGYHQVRYRITG